ncbi:MAG: LamG-like jellyroll fold domain-containing protein [Myxococcota bacterium]
MPLALVVLLGFAALAADAQSLRFRGHGGSPGENFVFPDRVKIDTLPPAAVNIGVADFTIEFFLRASAADNPNGGFACGFGIDWVNSNILIDRDRFGQPRKVGIGLLDGAVAFGVGDDFVDYTLCGSVVVADDAWHHVAVERRASDGRLRIWVDGVLDTEGPVSGGPTGDVSYPVGAVPGTFCSPDGGSGASPCDNSDPFWVFGAEKHGFAGINYDGFLDEVRFSTVLRYTTPFPPPTTPFAPDAQTAALYHFDEGAGATTADATGNGGTGTIFFGGSAPPGPEWVAETPFAFAVPSIAPLALGALAAGLGLCGAVGAWRAVARPRRR